MERFVFKERRGREFTSLCLRSIREQIARMRALDNPNQMYLVGLEKLAAEYAKGRDPR